MKNVTAPFYITGLPRSRTAWLARVFTLGRVRCLHDAAARFGVDRLPDVLASVGGMAGVSDSGLALVRDKLPVGKWLVVRRDFQRAAESFLSMPRYRFETGDHPRSLAPLYEIEHGLKEIERTEDCRTVAFDDLDDEQTVRAAWKFLIGDAEPWCAWHWDEMRHLRVTVRPETY
jgi:hypothetical protein